MQQLASLIKPLKHFGVALKYIKSNVKNQVVHPRYCVLRLVNPRPYVQQLTLIRANRRNLQPVRKLSTFVNPVNYDDNDFDHKEFVDYNSITFSAGLPPVYDPSAYYRSSGSSDLKTLSLKSATQSLKTTKFSAVVEVDENFSGTIFEDVPKPESTNSSRGVYIPCPSEDSDHMDDDPHNIIRSE